MTLPFPAPTTRAEARANAIHLVSNGGTELIGARAWASIALTFPEDPAVDIDPRAAAFQKMIDSQEPAGSPAPGYQSLIALPSSMVGDDDAGDVIRVSALAWDVLRNLAMQYVVQCPGRMCDLDRSNYEESWDILIEQTGQDAPVRVTLRFH